MKQPHGVRAATDTGHNGIGQSAFSLHDLGACFLADDRLEITDHLWIGVRSGNSAYDIEMRFGIGHPIAQRLVHCVLQRAGAYRDRVNFCTQQAHAVDIRLLAAHILFTHEDFAFHVKQGAGGGCCNTMLACTGLGDDFGFAHTLGDQRLTDHVVDLVRACMVQLIALQIQLCAAKMGGHPLGKIQRAGAADIMRLVIFQFTLEVGISDGAVIGLFNLQDQRHQGFGNKPAAMHAEPAAIIWLVAKRVHVHICHDCLTHVTAKRPVCRQPKLLKRGENLPQLCLLHKCLNAGCVLFSGCLFNTG